MQSYFALTHISKYWLHICLWAKMVCALLFSLCHHDAFQSSCFLLTLSYVQKRFWPSEKPYCSRSTDYENFSNELRGILSISLNAVRVTENTRGPQSLYCGFAFIVSLDKQEGEFSLAMTQWLISCFFSSIFFLLCKWAWIVCRGQEGRERQSLLVKHWYQWAVFG